MVENAIPSAFARILAALPAEEFLGRSEPLERLVLLAREAARGLPCALAIESPSGGGKSELLRQLAAALTARGVEAMPIYLDLADLLPSHAPAIESPESEGLRRLFRAVLRQVLLRGGKLDLRDAQWLEADPVRLAGFCYGAGYSGLVPFATASLGHLSGREAWRGLFQALASHHFPPLILLLDGLSHAEPAQVSALLAVLLEAARRERVSVICEALPGEPSAPLPAGMATLRLAPLPLADALRLARAAGERRGWTLPEASLCAVLPRLGPWPGWVQGWAAQVKPSAQGLNPIRVAEEAYLDFLEFSPWAGQLQRRFERLVPLTLRERALRLARVAFERAAAPISPEEAPLILGTAGEQAESLLAALTSLGLLSRQGTRWGAPQASAVADWAKLSIAETVESSASQAVRLDLLSHLLTQERPATEESAAGLGVEQALPAILGRFRGQMLSPVLFEFANYYEAVGRLPREKRREMVFNATASLCLPEVIGVVPWHPAAFDRKDDAHAPRYFYARAYRAGKYQRSHEEVWLAIDLSAARLLTTPEIEQALAALLPLEESLRPNHFVRWVILGEGASPEALELIRQRGLYCSSCEQLSLIRELLAPPAVRVPHASLPEREPSRAAAQPPERPSVIEMDQAAQEPRAETSNLSLPARDGSELIAALTAEKIAIRCGFDASQAGQIKTAVLEGLLNAIEHSPNQEKLIYIEFLVTPQALEVTIENEGVAFDPLAVPAPDPRAKLSSAHKRGWGLSLMKRFMDEVGYEPCARGTRLRLVKRRRPEPLNDTEATTEKMRGKQ